VYTYGEDYGPKEAIIPNNYTAKGIFYANRTPYPHAWEMKKVYQDIHTNLAGEDSICIYNERFFTDLSNVTLQWELVLDGKRIQTGEITHINVQAQESRTIYLPYKKIRNGEAFLNLTYRIKQAQSLVPAGHIVATEQLPVHKAPLPAATIQNEGSISRKEFSGKLQFTGTKASVTFDKATGAICQYCYNGVAMLDPAYETKPNFWRAPTDNDYGAKTPQKLQPWKEATIKQELLSFQDTIRNGLAIVNVTCQLPSVQAILRISYTLNAAGKIKVEQLVEVSKDSTVKIGIMPRFGMQWILPQGFNQLEYYGRGPHENYQDRNFSAHVGLYKQKVDEQFFPYVIPQETGNKTDIRWFRISNAKGKGIFIHSDSLLSISALHYFDSDLDNGMPRNQRHAADLEKRPQTRLNIDLAQMGVGGIDSWGAMPMQRYLLLYDDYRFSYTIEPF
jgi:beta-galactosidase